MGKRSKGKRRHPARRESKAPARRRARYSTLELVLAGLGAVLVVFFLGLLISALL